MNLVYLWIALPVTAIGWWIMKKTESNAPTAPAEIDALLTAAPFARNSRTWAPGNINVTGPQRLANARIIVSEFLAAGFSPALALAAVVNADRESALDARAIGDGGKSVGLFQLHENGGGRGMSVADRQNPVLNARRMIQETRAAWNSVWQTYPSLASAVSQNASVAELAGLFAVHVERPADRPGQYTERAQIARDWGW